MINSYTYIVSVCDEMINLIVNTSYNIIVNHQRFSKFIKQIFEIFSKTLIYFSEK